MNEEILKIFRNTYEARIINMGLVKYACGLMFHRRWCVTYDFDYRIVCDTLPAL